MANLNSEKKYHFIYKTTNLKNGKFYIGMHSTNNLNDGYLGSGKRLRYSIRKHGVENFKIEYLEFFNNRINLANREKELINEDLIKHPMCMNLKTGGTGGNIGPNGEVLGGDKFKGAHLYWAKPENKERLRKITSERVKKRWEDGLIVNFKYDWTGKKHKEETKQKIGKANSIKQKGEGNSQYGKPKSEETKKKQRESLLKTLGINDDGLTYKEKKIKSEIDKTTYTINGIFINKQRRNIIKKLFNIDFENRCKDGFLELKELLFDLYVTKNNSTLSIADTFNTNDETIRNYLSFVGIKRKTLSEAIRNYTKKWDKST